MGLVDDAVEGAFAGAPGPEPPGLLRRGWSAAGAVGHEINPKTWVDRLFRASARNLFDLPVSDTASVGPALRSGLGANQGDEGYVGKLVGKGIEFAGDVGLDPLTYIAGGVGGIASKGLAARSAIGPFLPEAAAAIDKAVRAGDIARKVGTAAGAGFTGLMGMGAIEEGKRAYETLQHEGFSPQAAEEVLGTALSAGGAGLGLAHLAGGLKPTEAPPLKPFEEFGDLPDLSSTYWQGKRPGIPIDNERLTSIGFPFSQRTASAPWMQMPPPGPDVGPRAIDRTPPPQPPQGPIPLDIGLGPETLPPIRLPGNLAPESQPPIPLPGNLAPEGLPPIPLDIGLGPETLPPIELPGNLAPEGLPPLPLDIGLGQEMLPPIPIDLGLGRPAIEANAPRPAPPPEPRQLGLPGTQLLRRPIPGQMGLESAIAAAERQAAPPAEAPAVPAPAEARTGERRVGPSIVPIERRIADRRAELAAQVELPVDHPAVDLAATAQIQARTDHLTGLGNRLAWDEMQATLNPDADQVFALDMKKFKPINDQYGHDQGDVVLKKVAEVLAEHLGQDNVARSGGDEFSAALRGMTLEEAQAKAADIQRVLQETPVDLVAPDGSRVTIPGLEAHIGVGRNAKEADVAANAVAAESRKGGRGDVPVAAAPPPPAPAEPAVGGLAGEGLPGGEPAGPPPAEVAAAAPEPVPQIDPTVLQGMRQLAEQSRAARDALFQAIREQYGDQAPQIIAQIGARSRFEKLPKMPQVGRKKAAPAPEAPAPVQAVAEEAAVAEQTGQPRPGPDDPVTDAEIDGVLASLVKAYEGGARDPRDVAGQGVLPSIKAEWGMDIPELRGYGRARLPKHIKEDANNPVYLAARNAAEEAIRSGRRLEAQYAYEAEAKAARTAAEEARFQNDAVEPEGPVDTSFNPEAIEAEAGGRAAPGAYADVIGQGPFVPQQQQPVAPAAKPYADVTPFVPQQRAAAAAPAPAATPRAQKPGQAAMFAGQDMLQGTARRVTEGREGEGPLFTQEADARARAEAAAQTSIPPPEPPPTAPPAPAPAETTPTPAPEGGGEAYKGFSVRPNPSGGVDIFDPSGAERANVTDVASAQRWIDRKVKAGAAPMFDGPGAIKSLKQRARSAGRTTFELHAMLGEGAGVFKDLATYGASLMERGIRNFPEWSRAMTMKLSGFVKGLKDHLERIYKDALFTFGGVGEAPGPRGASERGSVSFGSTAPGAPSTQLGGKGSGYVPPPATPPGGGAPPGPPTPASIARAKAATEKATLGEQLIEAHKGGLVSGLGTPVSNVLSTAANTVVGVPEAGVAPLIDRWLTAIHGGPRTRFSGEALEQARGGLSALIRSGPNGLESPAGRTLADAIRSMFSDAENWGAIGSGPNASPFAKKAGKFIRGPLMALKIGDKFTDHINESAVAPAFALREAKRQLPAGTPAQIEALKQQLLAKPTPELRKAIRAEVSERQFHGKEQDPGSFIKKLINMRNEHKWLHAIFPFIETPAHIADLTIQRSPLGFVKAGRAYNIWRRAVKGGAAPELIAKLKGEAVDAIARPLVGTMILGTFGAAAKAGMMTGSGPTDPRQRRVLRESGWQPYSFRFGNSYIPYNRFEPISGLLGFAADMQEARNSKDANDLFGKAIDSIGQNLLSKTYLQGLAEAGAAIADPGQALGKFVSNTAGSFVPNIVAKTAQAIDPVVRDTSDESGLVGLPGRTLKTVASRLPGISQLLPAQRSGTGEPVERPGNAFTRFALPVQPSQRKPYADFNELLVNIGAAPSEPQRELVIPNSKGKTVRLSEDELDVISAANAKATDYLRRVTRSPSFQQLGPEDQKSLVQRTYARYRTEARQRLYRRPSFATKARAVLREARAQ